MTEVAWACPIWIFYSKWEENGFLIGLNVHCACVFYLAGGSDLPASARGQHVFAAVRDHQRALRVRHRHRGTARTRAVCTVSKMPLTGRTAMHEMLIQQ